MLQSQDWGLHTQRRHDLWSLRSRRNDLPDLRRTDPDMRYNADVRAQNWRCGNDERCCYRMQSDKNYNRMLPQIREWHA